MCSRIACLTQLGWRIERNKYHLRIIRQIGTLLPLLVITIITHVTIAPGATSSMLA